MSMKEISSSKLFDGQQIFYTHYSDELKYDHQFTVYLPPKALKGERCACLYFLYGASENEFETIYMSTIQKYAAKYDMIIVTPEIAPLPYADRKNKRMHPEYFIPFGFYMDATEPKYSEHFRMYSYVTKELAELVNQNFPIDQSRRGILGHSLGGLGAAACALRNPNLFQSLSLMAAISHYGHKYVRYCFQKLLGDDESRWQQYSASILAEKYRGPFRHILFDQGLQDDMETFTASTDFVAAVIKNSSNLSIKYRMHGNYNHAVGFIPTFIEDHVIHHHKILNRLV